MELYYVRLFHSVIEDSLDRYLGIAGLLLGALAMTWATHRWQLKRLVLYIGIGFLIIGMVCLNLI
jgi:hypothetical protein